MCWAAGSLMELLRGHLLHVHRSAKEAERRDIQNLVRGAKLEHRQTLQKARQRQTLLMVGHDNFPEILPNLPLMEARSVPAGRLGSLEMWVRAVIMERRVVLWTRLNSVLLHCSHLHLICAHEKTVWAVRRCFDRKRARIKRLMLIF